MKKILSISVITFFIFTNAFAGADGELELSKKSKPVKDCFEPINRVTFAVNQGLDKVIFKPVAIGYRALPSPVRTGVSNALDNLSNLVTIPNNVLQGELKKAGVNTGRFVINTTIGIVGLFDDDPKKINSQVAGLVIKPLSDLEKYCEKFNVAIGIIATPGEHAQGVADQLINCGVRSILNFAPVLLKNTPDVQIRSVDLSQELQILSYYLDRPVLKAVD